MAEPSDVASLIRAHRDRLSPAERKVADVVLSSSQAAAFGTVAEVAAAAGTSGATVVRLAARLGLSGFAELQDLARSELARDARRATERLEGSAHADVLEHTVEASIDALGALAERAGPAFDEAVGLLSRRRGRVFVMTSEASAGVGRQFAGELGLLRPGVVHVGGSEVAVSRALADAGPGDTAVVLDVPRLDRAVVRATRHLVSAGVDVVALAHSELSPLADGASVVLIVSHLGVGPFDSHVAALALFEALSSAVASRRHRTASVRLRSVESAWDDAEVFDD